MSDRNLGMGRCACGSWAVVRLDGVPFCQPGLDRELEERELNIREARRRAMRSIEGLPWLPPQAPPPQPHRPRGKTVRGVLAGKPEKTGVTAAAVAKGKNER